MRAISSEWVEIAALTREGRSLSNLETRERQGRGMGGLFGIVGRCTEKSRVREHGPLFWASFRGWPH